MINRAAGEAESQAPAGDAKKKNGGSNGAQTHDVQGDTTAAVNFASVVSIGSDEDARPDRNLPSAGTAKDSFHAAGDVILICPRRHKIVRTMGFILLFLNLVLALTTVALKIAHFAHNMPESVKRTLVQLFACLPSSALGFLGAVFPLWFARIRRETPKVTRPFSPFFVYNVAVVWALALVQAGLLYCVGCIQILYAVGGACIFTKMLLSVFSCCYTRMRASKTTRYNPLPQDNTETPTD